MLLINILEAAIRLSVPVLFVALGEAISQRGGMVNIGLEGFMSVGAFTSFALMASIGNPWIAVAGAALVGTFCAAIMALFAVWGKINQILIGFSLFVALPGLSAYLIQQDQSGGFAAALQPYPIPCLNEIPVIGAVLFAQNGFFYGVVVAAVVVAILLDRTRFGLALGACGHDPAVARSKGINVEWVRTSALLACGALAGIGGAALAIGALGSFTPGVTGGRGFIAIALVILGRWRVGGVVLAAFAIGLVDAIRLRLGGVVAVPVSLLAMAPWLVVLVMLIAGAKKSRMPPALGKDLNG
ncbi:ABC transporter permease [Paraburkholderia sp. 22B1P]|jgi:simple sugar transport system permease protein|uniref:ABC transporter permease n=1 Tax=Paraburkholderia sp. 22B1P TaxID=3080498 RepID=UPI003089AED8|nr:ABC transporter permease [Paraburkholderia sp. 22B1P]